MTPLMRSYLNAWQKDEFSDSMAGYHNKTGSLFQSARPATEKARVSKQSQLPVTD